MNYLKKNWTAKCYMVILLGSHAYSFYHGFCKAKRQWLYLQELIWLLIGKNKQAASWIWYVSHGL